MRINALNVLQDPLPGPDAFVSNGRIVAEYPSRLKYKAASTPVPVHPPEVQSDLPQNFSAAQDQGGICTLSHDDYVAGAMPSC